MYDICNIFIKNVVKHKNKNYIPIIINVYSIYNNTL